MRQTASLRLPLAARQSIHSHTLRARDRLDISGVSSSLVRIRWILSDVNSRPCTLTTPVCHKTPTGSCVSNCQPRKRGILQLRVQSRSLVVVLGACRRMLPCVTNSILGQPWRDQWKVLSPASKSCSSRIRNRPSPGKSTSHSAIPVYTVRPNDDSRMQHDGIVKRLGDEVASHPAPTSGGDAKPVMLHHIFLASPFRILPASECGKRPCSRSHALIRPMA